MLRKRFGAVIASVVIACACFGFAADRSAAAPSAPRIAWSKCYQSMGPFECGTVQVPLDYDQATGSAISIAVIRLPAT